MKDIYNDSSYLQANSGWHEEDALFKADKILKLLEKIPETYQTIAEAGCGSAQILVELSKKLPDNIKLFGFDISGDAINIAKKKETARIKIEKNDFAKDTNENYFFDVLLVIDVIEHVENYFEFLNGILEKSKYTIFHIPLDMSVWSLFREKMLIESKQRVGHIHNFTEDFIKSILQDHEFEIIHQIYTEPSFQIKSFKQAIINNLRKVFFKINKRFATKTLGGYSILLLAKSKR